MKRREQVRDFSKAFRRLVVTAVLAVFIMVSAIPSLAATYQDGTYSVPVSLSGGSGRNTVVSPCTVTVSGGQIHATVIFSKVSKKEPPEYTYLTTSLGTVYPQPYDSYSQVFYNVPIAGLGNVNISMETTKMSTPYTLNYTLHFDASAIPTVGGSSSGDNSTAVSGGSGGDSSNTSEKKHEAKKDNKKDEKSKEESKESKDAKDTKTSDNTKNTEKKAGKKADAKKQTSTKASEKKNSKLPLYIGGLVVSLGIAGVGVFMLLKGRKIK